METTLRSSTPSAKQIRVTEEVVAWYLRTYWMTRDDLGTPETFLDRDRVGAFAVDPAAFEAGDPVALGRILVAVSLFQRLRDQLVLKILQRIPAERVDVLTTLDELAGSALAADCTARQSLEGLRTACDLHKDDLRRGACSREPSGACPLHRHTEDLCRYGHFGKVPTSLALAIHSAGASDLPDLYRRVLGQHRRRAERAEVLEQVLCRAWRVEKKIASMFLSLVCTPGLSRWRPPWRSGVAWERYVVVDSNVDAYLATIGYRGAGSYDARRTFVMELARRIDLRQHSRRLPSFNPRIVQQAAYVFAGRSNRVANPRDCGHSGAGMCAQCPRLIRRRCSVRTAPGG